MPCGLVAGSKGISQFHASGLAKPLFDVRVQTMPAGEILAVEQRAETLRRGDLGGMQGGVKKSGEREEQRDFHARLGLSSLRLNSLVFRGAEDIFSSGENYSSRDARRPR